MHKMPGRLVERDEGRPGARGFVLTLQAREQHIRQEKPIQHLLQPGALRCAR